MQLDGTLAFEGPGGLDRETYIKRWPRINGRVMECVNFNNFTNVTFTSSGVGTLQGDGAKWWGIPGIGYLLRQENRPRLFAISNSQSILFERIALINSP